jgi:hypothetical protein
MLGLTLRSEFRGQHLPATAISLIEPDGTGATQVAVDRILSIAYPTGDIQTALRAFHGSRPPRPLVLQGSRGKGKSHLLAFPPRCHGGLSLLEVGVPWVEFHQA